MPTTTTLRTRPTETQGVLEVDAKDLAAALEGEDVVVIDVREPGEYASGRIPGARLVPKGWLGPDDLPADGQATAVLYCRSSKRSGEAAERLACEPGVARVVHLKGGLQAWEDAGLPMEADEDAPLDIIRQVQIAAGSLVLTGVLLGWLVSPWFYLLSAFIGGGLVFAGVTGTCGLALLLQRMPWNRRAYNKPTETLPGGAAG